MSSSDQRSQPSPSTLPLNQLKPFSQLPRSSPLPLNQQKMDEHFSTSATSQLSSTIYLSQVKQLKSSGLIRSWQTRRRLHRPKSITLVSTASCSTPSSVEAILVGLLLRIKTFGLTESHSRLTLNLLLLLVPPALSVCCARLDDEFFGFLSGCCVN